MPRVHGSVHGSTYVAGGQESVATAQERRFTGCNGRKIAGKFIPDIFSHLCPYRCPAFSTLACRTQVRAIYRMQQIEALTNSVFCVVQIFLLVTSPHYVLSGKVHNYINVRPCTIKNEVC